MSEYKPEDEGKANKQVNTQSEVQSEADSSAAHIGDEVPKPQASLNIDAQIRAAKRKGNTGYLLAAVLSTLVLAVFFIWLLFVKAHLIVVAPSEALPSAQIRVQEGVAMVFADKVYSIGKGATITVSAERFETNTTDLSLIEHSIVEVLLTPSPGVINANAGDIEGETTWFIDERIVHIGASLSHALAPGNYTVSVQNPYYLPWQQSLQVERGTNIELVPQLQQVQGSLRVATRPSGAEVQVNTTNVRTPSNIDLLGGRYQVSVQREGYEPINESIAITYNNSNVQRSYRLEALKASVDLRIKPLGGLLLVDGQEVRAQSQTSLRLAADRSHDIRYTLAGHYPFTRTIAPKVDEPIQIEIALQQEIGEVSFTSSLPAQVSVNGKHLGQTPISTRLQALPTQVVFTKAGYRSVSSTLRPSGNKPSLLHATMLTEFEARRAAGQALFVSGLGIQMQRFRPDDVVMGSAVNVIGRQRNEHQVQVEFTRPIWVSQHEITQAQYAAFDASTPRSALPVNNITWLQAAQYCNWLSEQEALPAFYRFSNGRLLGINPSSNGYRLPTEAEWEWLAKKSNRAKATEYVWGSVARIPSNSANFGDQSASNSLSPVLDKYNDGYPGLAPVGSFKPDNAGLYDLAGNVSEWVNDYYTNVPPDTSVVHPDYLGAASGQQFVVKGANYTSGRMRDLRAAARIIGEKASETIGFRIARYDQASAAQP